MADYAPLVLVTGVRQQLQAADTVLANGVTARTGTNLALIADAAQVVTIPANVDLQFGAVDGQIGSSGAMIDVQNLLDKTATETITGAWTYNNNIAFDAVTRTIAGIQNGNLVDKTADETVTMGIGDGWNFISSGDNTSPNLTVQATASQEVSTNRILFQVLASGGGNLFSVDSEGDVAVAGAETVSGASTVVGTANFQGDVNLGNGSDTITIGSGLTDTITFGGPTTITIPDTENWTAITIDNNDATNGPIGFRVHGANLDTFQVDYDSVAVTTTAGIVDITAGGLLDINAGANLDIDVTGTYNMLASSTVTLAGTGASSLTITSGNLTLSTATSGDVAVTSAAEILFNDLNRTGSTWAATSVKLTETTGEWDTYESNFGEVSIFNAINQAFTSSSSAVQEMVLLSLTTTGLVDGDLAYLSANDTVLQADANGAIGLARAMGVYDGTVGEVVVQGRIDVTLNDGTTPSPGVPIYVSTIAGRGTATAPSTAGEYITCIGYVVDNTGYSATPGNTVECMLNFERPVLI